MEQNNNFECPYVSLHDLISFLSSPKGNGEFSFLFYYLLAFKKKKIFLTTEVCFPKKDII